MLDFVGNDFLSQMVSERTRDNNILDLVLVTWDNSVENVTISEHLGSYDDRLVRLDVRARISVAVNKILVLNFNKANFDGIRQSLKDIKLASNTDVEESWQGSKAQLLTE